MTGAIGAARRRHVGKRGAHTGTRHLCSTAAARARLTGGRGTGMLSSAYCASSRAARSSSSARPRRSGVDCGAWGAGFLRSWNRALPGSGYHPDCRRCNAHAAASSGHCGCTVGPMKPRSSHPLPAHLHGHQSADLVAPRPRVEVRIALLIRQLLHHALDTHLRPAGRRWWAAATGGPASSSACRIAGGGGVRPGRPGQAARARACPPAAAGAPTKRRWRRGGSPPAACPAARGVGHRTSE